jgi:hypothetical protein
MKFEALQSYGQLRTTCSADTAAHPKTLEHLFTGVYRAHISIPRLPAYESEEENSVLTILRYIIICTSKQNQASLTRSTYNKEGGGADSASRVPIIYILWLLR